MIGIIIGGHGGLPQELLRACEMICGTQKNIRTVSFQVGEDADIVRRRYEEAIAELDCADGVLFLCDLFGGSPFNEASRMAVLREDYGVLTGVNLPLLVTLTTSRNKLDGSLPMRALIDAAEKMAHEGIERLHADDIDDEKAAGRAL